MNTVPTPHPTWCARDHAEGFPGHTADLGCVDLGEIDLAVTLYQYGDDAPKVWLCEQRHDATSVTELSAEQAEALGWRLVEAAGTIARRQPIDGPPTHDDRVDLLAGRLTRMLGDWHTSHGNSGPGGPM